MIQLSDITTGIVAHQCNCMGYMGCGVALAIRQMYPRAYTAYVKYGHRTGNGQLQLGMVQLVTVSPTLRVANLMAQFNISRQRRMTDYAALETCCRKLAYKCAKRDISLSEVWFPHKMGCGNAGGDWTVVSSIIEKFFISKNYFFNPSNLRRG